MGLLSRGATWLAAKMKANESRTITYHRLDASVAIEALPGQTLLQLQMEDGNIAMVWTDRDYLFTKADLVLFGAATEPAKGDWIEDSLDDAVLDVLPYGGEPVWKPCDPHNVAIRVHCKLRTR